MHPQSLLKDSRFYAALAELYEQVRFSREMFALCEATCWGDVSEYMDNLISLYCFGLGGEGDLDVTGKWAAQRSVRYLPVRAMWDSCFFYRQGDRMFLRHPLTLTERSDSEVA